MLSAATCSLVAWRARAQEVIMKMMHVQVWCSWTHSNNSKEYYTNCSLTTESNTHSSQSFPLYKLLCFTHNTSCHFSPFYHHDHSLLYLVPTTLHLGLHQQTLWSWLYILENARRSANIVSPLTGSLHFFIFHIKITILRSYLPLLLFTSLLSPLLLLLPSSNQKHWSMYVGSHLELDFWIPELKLAFEYQVLTCFILVFLFLFLFLWYIHIHILFP